MPWPRFWPCAASAQWLTNKTPNVPRTADGKPNLTAPAPKMADGKPDLSGIWNPNPRYLVNLAADLKPGEVSMQPWAEAIYKERAAGLHAQRRTRRELPAAGRSQDRCRAGSVEADSGAGPGGDPVRSVHAIPPDLHGRPQAARRSESHLAGLFGRTLGWRRAGGGKQRLQRQGVARSVGPSRHREAARNREIPAQGFRAHGDRNHHRRSGRVHQALDRHGNTDAAGGYRAAGIRLRRERTGHQAHGARRNNVRRDHSRVGCIRGMLFAAVPRPRSGSNSRLRESRARPTDGRILPRPRRAARTASRFSAVSGR